MRRFALLSQLAVASGAAWRNLTLYHVNALSQGVIPRNMDTSDIFGDIFFDLRSIVLPIECKSPFAWPGDCANQELIAEDLVISELVVQVNTDFGEYGKCNVCNASGVDPFSRLSCVPGEYICSCGDYDRNVYECKQQPVGRENITQVFGNFECTWDMYMDAPWRCWQFAVTEKTGGLWYSTFTAGECADEHDTNCSWRVLEVPKVVRKDCSDAAIFAAVEEADQAHCFDKCANEHTAPRNTSTPCWIGCFYRTVLGADGMLPSGSGGGFTAQANADDGIPLETLVQAWNAPFATDDPTQGGCPAVPLERYAHTLPRRLANQAAA